MKHPSALTRKLRLSAVALIASHATGCTLLNPLGHLQDGDDLGSCDLATSLCAVSVSAGDAHTCAARKDGRVVCWGANDHGQLAGEPSTGATAPKLVDLPEPARSVRASEEATCALGQSGAVYCWGGNSQDEIGDGADDGMDVLKPIQVLTDSGSPLAGAQEISGGGKTYCVVLDSRAVACWGYNGDGNGGSDGPQKLPGAKVVPGVVPDAFVSGKHVACFLAGGNVSCWGDDSGSALDDTNGGFSATPVAIDLPTAAAGVASGWGHACAILASGSLWCWGSDSYGETGAAGATLKHNTNIPGPVRQFEDGGNGYDTTIGLTGCARRDHDVLCVGANERGQLGRGMTDAAAAMAPPHDEPGAVVGLADTTAITVGGGHACAIDVSGDVLCWGANDKGQVGDGTTQDRAAVTRVLLPSP